MIIRAINFLFSFIADRVDHRLCVVPYTAAYKLEGDVPRAGHYGRLWLGVRRFGSWFSRAIGIRMFVIRKGSDVEWKVAKKDTKDILESVDYERITALRSATLVKHQALAKDANDVDGAWKFLDIDLWVPVNLERAYHLGVHSSPPLDILDISGGAGYFAYICKHFGHRVHTTDIDQWEEFNEMMEIFGLTRDVLWVNPRTPIPSYGRRFDLITSFMIAFNFPKEEASRWGIEEWDFLLRDLEDNHLKENGTIYLLLNPHEDGAWYSPELLEYFVGRGAEVNDAEVIIRKGTPALLR